MKKDKNTNFFPLLVYAFIIFLVLFIFIGFVTGLFDNIIQGLIGDDDPDDVSVYSIPNMETESDKYRPVYSERSDEKVIEFLKTIDSYIHVIEIHYSETASEELKITKHGDKIRVESDNRLIICDGQSSYLKIGDYTYSRVGKINYFEELGLTTLESVLSLIGDSRSSYNVSQTGKTVNVQFMDEESGTIEEYSIDVESGLVAYENSIQDNITFRQVYTVSIDVLNDEELPQDFWKIPD